MDSMWCVVLQDRDDVLTCLVTGNLQPIGWAKMEALGIKHLFSEPFFGGFGSDYCNPDNSDQSWKDRAELVKIAAQKAEKHFPGDNWTMAWPQKWLSTDILPNGKCDVIAASASVSLVCEYFPYQPSRLKSKNHLIFNCNLCSFLLSEREYDAICLGSCSMDFRAGTLGNLTWHMQSLLLQRNLQACTGKHGL